MKQVCHFCDGSGKVSDFPKVSRTVTCSRCRGSGIVDISDDERCPECGGSGGSMEGKFIYFCKKCGGTGKKGCFITTAVVNVLNKDDHCDELEILRDFRDNYLLKNKKTRTLVYEYYRISPEISKNIKNNDREFIENIFNNYICISVKQIENHSYDEAINTYKEMVKLLSGNMNIIR